MHILLKRFKEVYRLQGVHINDKHIEVVVRQMLRKVMITDSGDTSFVSQQQVDRFTFREEKQACRCRGWKSFSCNANSSWINKDPEYRVLFCEASFLRNHKGFNGCSY